MFLIFNPHTTPTATPSRTAGATDLLQDRKLSKMSQGWSCIWTTEPSPLNHWERTGGGQTATIQAPSAASSHRVSSTPSYWNTNTALPGISAAAAGQDTPPACNQQDVLFLCVPRSTPLVLGTGSSLWLVPQAVCASPLQTWACIHHPWNRQNLYFGWDQATGLLTDHTLELWAWEMYQQCLSTAAYGRGEGTV